MQQRRHRIIIILGAVLILFALTVFAVFIIQLQLGSKHNEDILASLNEILPKTAHSGSAEDHLSPQMPLLEFDGTDYVALLEIPSMSVTLPIKDKWSNSILYSSPARLTGSAYEDSLVIGGSAYPGIFDFCGNIELNTTVFVTDMTGTEFSYSVVGVDRSSSAETDWLTSDKWDLTIFCRDFLSFEYIAVRCSRTYK